jgi:hypothetical protein
MLHEISENRCYRNFPKIDAMGIFPYPSLPKCDEF